VDQLVPPWEMAFWNDEWAPCIVLPLIIIVVIVQYFCGHGFGLSYDFLAVFSGWRKRRQPVCYPILVVMSSHHLVGLVPCFLVMLLCCLSFPSFFFAPSLIFLVALLVGYPFWLLFFYPILRFLLAIFRGVCNGLFDTVYLQPGALSIKQSSYVISRTGLIFLTMCTSFYQ
jgi:hypothetical protein